MCGIIGISGKEPVVSDLVASLELLEPRGYDSTGLCARAVGGLVVVKKVGDVAELRRRLTAHPSTERARSAIGHTRWATHGGVTDRNAHPFSGCSLAFGVAVNGVIDDADAVRAALTARGHRFESETDSEVVVHLLEEAPGGLVARVRSAAARLSGSFSLVAVARGGGERVVGLHHGAPLLVAIGSGRNGVCSAADAVPWATSFLPLVPGDLADVRAGDVRVRSEDGALVDRAPITDTSAAQSADATSATAFESEIREQPAALEATIRSLLRAGDVTLSDELSAVLEPRPGRVVLVGCGSAANAATVSAAGFAAAGIPCDVRVASEWDPALDRVDGSVLVVGVSQSGETADTLDALRAARAVGARTVAVTNSPTSQIVREVDGVVLTRAGRERSVAASKTFTCQVAALALLALRLGGVTEETAHAHDLALLELAVLPELVSSFLEASSSADIEGTAALLAAAPYLVYLGTGSGLAVAAEGALKIREVAAVPVEVHPLGELKHGPFALLGPGVPVVCVLPGGPDHRVLASLAEIRARGATVVVVTGCHDQALADAADRVIALPTSTGVAAALLCVLPLQLLALRAAEKLGMPVDRPRNLAKTVTVR